MTLKRILASALLVVNACLAQQQSGALMEAKRSLAARDFAQARTLYAAWLLEHPDSLEAQLGEADAELGLHRYEAAELGYRRVVAVQPEMWLAHKNLVIVEAALGRWQEFDRERALLRGARERGAPGISRSESDVIDAFDIVTRRGLREHWTVREYYVPVGRSLSRYNFASFDTSGRVKAYISLESAQAARLAMTPGDIVVGADTPPAAIDDWALNFYTGSAHGQVARYDKGEPPYERVRADVMQWLRR